MNPNQSKNHSVAALTAMVAIFAIAYGFDRFILFLRQLLSRTFQYQELVLSMYGIASLVLAALLVGLIAWLLLRAQIHSWVAWVFVLVGLPISFAPILQFVPPFTVLLQWTGALGIRPYLSTVASFFVVIGVIVLWRNWKQ